MPQNKGKIHIYTGDGKGKTTAALGLALRALGADLKVGIIYFDKGGDYYSEHKILDNLKDQGLIYQAFGMPRMMGQKFRFENIPDDIYQAESAIKTADDWMQTKNLDLLILDEINTTIRTELLKLEDIISLLKQKPNNLELVLTGRYCPPEIMAFGDLITEMKLIKHYMDQGQDARKGIEY